MKLGAPLPIFGVCLSMGLLFTGCIKYQPRPISAPVIENRYRARNIDAEGLRKFAQSTGQKQWPLSVFDLNALMLIATYYSPDLDLARSQLAIADAAVQTAGARINPSLSANGGYNADPATHPLYGGSPTFTIETAGKRRYRILQAEKNEEAARLSLTQAQWLLWSKVRSALVDYLLTQQRLTLLEQAAQLRSQTVEMLEKRLSVGEASAPEVNVYRVELLSAQAAAEAAKGDMSQKLVALTTVVGVPPGVLENRDIQYAALHTPPTDISLPLRRVQRAGLLHRIDVQRTLVSYAAADASLRLEIARQYPDVQLGPSYDFQEGFAQYTFTSLISGLPVFQHNQGPIAAAEARRQQIENQLRALQSQAIGEMAKALAAYRSGLQQWQQESGRLAQVQGQIEQSARQALKTGEGDRLSLVLAEIQTNTVAAVRLDALVRVQTALGALEDSAQQPLEPGISIPPAPPVNPRNEVVQ